ncbi:MAG TPA: class I SAM-dependent methyltransferase [Frankiaceae bacterium]|nr:class I SAM-dependent methyltransferase [Frankiaceae bacterium]
MSSGVHESVDPMQAEFDVVARWTEQAVEELGPDYAIPAGCRGTGSPSAFAWLAEALEVGPDTRFLDSGAGVGGPGAWLRERYGPTPVLAEPMNAAATASLRLFGLPSVVAWSQSLPFRSDAFDAVWSLGVLCTVPDKQAFLAETSRVLAPNGRLGLLVYVRGAEDLPETPDGNDFPTDEGLHGDLGATGFTVVQSIDAASLGRSPLAWQSRLDRVEDLVRDRHGHTDAWQEADAQSAIIGRLIAGGHVRAVLVHAVAT